MERTLKLAGFFAAHGVWCVAEDGPLIPMLAHETASGERAMARYAADRLEDGVAQALSALDANAVGAARAVVVYDGYITLDTGRTDALFIVMRSFDVPVAGLTMAVPYRNVESPEGFAVFRPKFIEWQGNGTPDYAALGEAFFEGVDSHSKGAAVWNGAIDPSA